MTDLLGCRYRSVQRRRFPNVPPTEVSRQRAARALQGRREALSLLPTAPLPGDFMRISVSGERETRAALDAGANVIIDAEFVVAGVRVHIDALIRTPDGYLPVVISSHRAARPAPMLKQEVIPTRRLGLGTPHIEGWKLRNHAADSFRLALADRALRELGLASGKGGAIGQDPTLTFIMRTEPLQAGLSLALEVPEPSAPRRVKECRSCRYWFDCHEQLAARDDISLLFSGDTGAKYADRGITTVQQLIDARLGQASVLAQAWRDGIPALRRHDHVTAPRFDVEIDIDLEAYLDIGAWRIAPAGVGLLFTLDAQRVLHLPEHAQLQEPAASRRRPPLPASCIRPCRRLATHVPRRLPGRSRRPGRHGISGPGSAPAATGTMSATGLPVRASLIRGLCGAKIDAADRLGLSPILRAPALENQMTIDGTLAGRTEAHLRCLGSRLHTTRRNLGPSRCGRDLSVARLPGSTHGLGTLRSQAIRM